MIVNAADTQLWNTIKKRAPFWYTLEEVNQIYIGYLPYIVEMKV